MDGEIEPVADTLGELVVVLVAVPELVELPVLDDDAVDVTVDDGLAVADADEEEELVPEPVDELVADADGVTVPEALAVADEEAEEEPVLEPVADAVAVEDDDTVLEEVPVAVLDAEELPEPDDVPVGVPVDEGLAVDDAVLEEV